MSRWAKISWLLCGLSILILVAVRFILGGWTNFLFIPLGVLCVSFGLAVFIDYKFYIEFFTLRTTKHGMNMGVLILLVIALLGGVNMLSVRFDDSIDLTSEKLNSLSDQTEKVINELKDDVQLIVFYRGEKDQNAKLQIKDLLSMYKESSHKVKIRFVNSYRHHAETQKYLKDVKGEPGLVVFVEYQKRKIRAQQPFREEQITTAIIKATRTEKKKIYFLAGHGEKEVESDDESDRGLSLLKQGLLDSSFEVETVSLLEQAELPSDASILAIVGPTTQFQSREMSILRQFARKGGRFFIAADPGYRSNIPQLVKSFGVEYANNFLINEFNFLSQRDAGEALGVVFDTVSDITRSFRSGKNFTAFPLASQVRKAPDAPGSLKFFDLVKTNEASYAVSDISRANKPKTPRQPFTLAVSAEGRLPGKTTKKSDGNNTTAEESSSDFAAVVFGDSDFVTNAWIIQGINRDLALNAMAYLAKEADLISIRPKKVEGTRLSMSSTVRVIVVVLGLLLPLALLISSGVIWFRRRGA